MNWITKILNVEPYKVTCLWNDGEIRVTDLADFINSKVKGPKSSFYPIKDKERFCEVKCDDTTIYWEDGLMFKDVDGTEKKGPLDIDPDYLFEISKNKK